MSCDREESIRKLPPGQLKNIRSLFEDGDSGMIGGKDVKRVPPARPILPPSRNKSPVIRVPAVRKGQPSSNNASENATCEAQLLDRKSYDASSARMEGSSPPLRRNRMAKHPGGVSPTVSRRIDSLVGALASVDSSSNNSVSANQISESENHPVSSVSVAKRISTLSNSSPVHRAEKEESFTSRADVQSDVGISALYSKVNKIKKNDLVHQNSVPTDVNTPLTRREAVRKHTDDRRNTVACFPEDNSEDSGVSVASRLRMFGGQQKSTEKPTPPKKPNVIKRQFSLRAAKECSPSLPTEPKSKETQEDVYDTPWDEKNEDSSVEKLKKLSKDGALLFDCPKTVLSKSAAAPPKRVLGQKPSLPSTPPPRVTNILSKCSEPFCNQNAMPPGKPVEPPPKPNQNALSSSKPSELPAKPKLGAPPKPPRTHAHDDYLKTKIILSESDNKSVEATNKVKSVVIIDSKIDSKESESTSILDRISKMEKQQHSFSNVDSKTNVHFRHRPPTRPPPPRQRPNSSGNPAMDEGPMIIPITPKPRLSRQKSAQNQPDPRSPSDELPLPPGKPITRFPLRKSLSSECIYGSRSRSLDSGQDDEGGQMTQSTYETEYEAVIDPDGYAVPNEFMKLPVKKKNSDMFYGEGQCPSQFLTKIEGFGQYTEVLTPQRKGDLHSFNQDASPGFGSNTARHEQCIEKVAKKKMLIVKQKINQAYADIDIVVRPMSQVEPDEYLPEMKEAVVEQSELKKRIDYCSTIRQKSRMSVKKSKEYLSAIYPQLFEYCLVVGLRALTNDPGYEPYVIHKFPENVSSNLSVPSFCFPDASVFKPGTMTSFSESYSFVMTYSDGSRVYGYCRRIQLADVSLPEVICIISPIDAFNMYNTLLNEIETRRRISLDLASEVIAASFGRPLPKPGKVCHIRTLDQCGEMETIFLNRPSDNRLVDVNYESPLCSLGTDKLVKVFASMLMERRIILCSSNLSVLTETVHALCALLYPFRWQHVYIPLLPPEMLDVVCAPMPYIVGILSVFLPQVFQMELEEVFVVDLDKKSIVKCVGDEATILPRKIQRALKTAINMCKIDNEARNAQWLMVAEAFLRMFIELIGHFGSHVCTQQDGNRIFQKEGFIVEMVSKEIRQFLEWFTETQMFEVFIVNHVEKSDWGSCDLFMQRLQDYKESKEESRSHKGLGAKVKNFRKAIKTKLAAS